MRKLLSNIAGLCTGLSFFILYVGHLAIGILYLVAIAAALREGLGFNGFFSFFTSFFISYFPVIGFLAAMYAVISVWNWGWGMALIILLAPYLVTAVFWLSSLFFSFLST